MLLIAPRLFSNNSQQLKYGRETLQRKEKKDNGKHIWVFEGKKRENWKGKTLKHENDQLCWSPALILDQAYKGSAGCLLDRKLKIWSQGNHFCTTAEVDEYPNKLTTSSWSFARASMKGRW